MEEKRLDPIKGWKRTDYCGDLRAKDIEREVTLFGWVDRRRDHGGLVFIDLRDRTGLVQLVFNPEVNASVHAQAQEVRNEFVLGVKGRVAKRPEGTVNPNLATGEVEVVVEELRLLNDCRPLPFALEEGGQVDEALRLRYRFLDLRRPRMQENFFLRHRIAQVTRNFLSQTGFLEIETPHLTKSTPEGARDYLVPSRTNLGCFFALPQSPQLFKQILMVSGFDRYFQIVRCFRDEDLRADRQPEFTQIDIEMSFVQREDILEVVEGLLCAIFEQVRGLKIDRPFRRITYDEAISRYGLDSPDLRFGLELVNITGAAQGVRLPPFLKALEEGGLIEAINLGPHSLSRKELDELADFVKGSSGYGLAWAKVSEKDWASPAANYFPPEVRQAIELNCSAKEGDLLLMAAGPAASIKDTMGRVRLQLGKKFGLMDEDRLEFVWITDFPLLEYSHEEGRLVSKHHPFTAPFEEDLPKLKERPEAVRAQAYDIVLNGTEVGGGSIRIHRKEVQTLLLEVLGYTPEEAQEKFGFLLEALEYGAPPHGGIALGLDRLVMMIAKEGSLREVIAFPKTSKGVCLMTGAPGLVRPSQLEELRLKLALEDTGE